MEGPIDILGLESRELIELSSRILPSGAGLAARLYAQASVAGRLDPESLGASERTAKAWRQNFAVGLLEVRRVVQAADCPVRKAVFATADGQEIESVLVPMRATRERGSLPGADAGERATLCVSSQAGCRMGCAFCETGLSGFRRDLGASEIVAQAITARVGLGWDFSNVVFMGMGEPLDNLAAVAKALRVFADPRGLGLSWERMTVCSSGPEGGIPALRSLGLKRLNLSISLNAADDGKRSALMPVNRSGGLARLERELVAYPQRKNFVLAVNYCLLPGINDGDEDAVRVASFCARIGRGVVNLIPYNPGSSPIAALPSEDDILAFEEKLRSRGCRVTLREAKGQAIMAGCGQLGSTSRATRVSGRRSSR